jgi:CheY-like chemotaxis protein
LGQIFANLIDNAHKFTPEDGTIEIRVRRQKREVVIEVRDSGIGIPVEVLPMIFDLFFQKSKGSDREKGGLGIGLTLAKNLAELHGGTLTAHSAGLGHGATFTLRLPLADEMPSQPGTALYPASPPAASPAAKLKIMVVEDQRISADSLGELLQSWGHVVTVCYDGRSALSRAEAFLPDLILLDIGLPDLNGYQVASQLRAIPALHRTRLAALTGYNPDTSRPDFKVFAEYFTKPVELDKLAAFLAGLKPDQGA